MEKAQTGLAALRLLPFIELFASGDKLPDFGLPLLLPPLLFLTLLPPRFLTLLPLLPPPLSLLPLPLSPLHPYCWNILS